MDHANATFLTAADLTLAALAFVSGSADIFAFLKFHDVFTSAMTGNTALLGLALGQGHILAAQRSLAALFGFCCGSIAGTIANEAAARHNRARRLCLLIGAEATCLALVLVLWAITRHPVYGPLLYVMILAGAFAMGLQSIAAREINIPGINTVVVTNTLTLVMSAVGAVLRRSLRQGRADVSPFTPVVLRQSGMLGIYLGGAALSGLLAETLPSLIAIPALAAVLLALVTARSFRDKPRQSIIRSDGII